METLKIAVYKSFNINKKMYEIQGLKDATSMMI